MRRSLTLIFAIFLTVALFSSTALSWGSATHAYMADKIGKLFGLKNTYEIYGSTVPDLFNYLFAADPELAMYQTDLRNLTHGIPGNESFMEVWYKGKWGMQKSHVYGFVAHNDVWAMDFTAHWAAGGTADEGYVITKAVMLEGILADQGAWYALGLEGELYSGLRLDLCHNIVEAAGDLMVPQLGDPFIGLKLISSAILRNPLFPVLLSRAYADDVKGIVGCSYRKAVGIIVSAEKEFRKTMVLQGQLLMQDPATALDLTAEQLAELSIAYLAAAGISLPPEITPEILKGMAKDALLAAMYILGDYMTEIDATIEYVAGQLEAHGVKY